MLFLASALLLGGMAGSVEETPAATVSPRSQLVFSIEASKTELALYERLTLTCKVENPTAEVIKANVMLLQAAQQIEFFITGPDQRTEEYRGRGTACVVLGETVHEPGSVMASEADLDWKGKESVLPVPGEYEIHARLWVGNDPTGVYLESNRLHVEVKEPSGADADAIAFFASKDEFRRLLRDGAAAYCRGKSGPGCFEEIRLFIHKHGASAYAPAITRGLAAAVAHGGVEVTPKYDLAIDLFRRFLQEWPDHPSAPRVMYGLVQTLDEAGRYDEAAQTILEFERTFPGEHDKARLLRENLESARRIRSE